MTLKAAKLKEAVKKQAVEESKADEKPLKIEDLYYVGADIPSFSTHYYNDDQSPSYTSNVGKVEVSEGDMDIAQRLRDYTKYVRQTKGEEEEHEEMLSSIRYREDSNSPSDINEDRDRVRDESTYNRAKQSLTAYIETKDKKHLVRFLFKSGILDMYSNPVCFYYPPSDAKDVDAEVERKTQREFNNMKHHIISALMDFSIADSSAVSTMMAGDTMEIMRNLYTTRPNYIFRAYIDNSEVYLEILHEFTSRNIDVDPDYLDARKTDFTFLRMRSRSITVIYAECIGELILCTRDYPMAERFNCPNHYDFMSHLPTLEGAPDAKENNKGRITINGTEYSRSAFESMVESNTEEFLNNLGIETYINDKEITIATGAVGDGNTDSGKVVELL